MSALTRYIPSNTFNSYDRDFDCDAATFRQDFGRSAFCSADYSVSCMGPCLSCVDGNYAYACTYE